MSLAGIGEKRNKAVPMLVRAFEGVRVRDVAIGGYHSIAITGALAVAASSSLMRSRRWDMADYRVLTPSTPYGTLTTSRIGESAMSSGNGSVPTRAPDSTFGSMQRTVRCGRGGAINMAS